MTRANWIKAAAGVLAAAAVLGYLYDPPWMGGVTSGMRPLGRVSARHPLPLDNRPRDLLRAVQRRDDDGAAARGVSRT